MNEQLRAEAFAARDGEFIVAGDEVTEVLVERQWLLHQHATYGESIRHIMDVFEEVKRAQVRFRALLGD